MNEASQKTFLIYQTFGVFVKVNANCCTDTVITFVRQCWEIVTVNGQTNAKVLSVGLYLSTFLFAEIPKDTHYTNI
jgi:hypothetical protein